MATINKSEFENICKEDYKQYQDLAKRFQNVKMENAEELNQLTIDTWLLACRWSEIQSMSKKISQECGVNKCDFSDWAYQKYRQLQELHITCRSWYRLAVEEQRQIRMMEGV
jgi:hypothetical protein